MGKHEPSSDYGCRLRSSFRLLLVTRISNEAGQNRQRIIPGLNDAMAKLDGELAVADAELFDASNLRSCVVPSMGCSSLSNTKSRAEPQLRG